MKRDVFFTEEEIYLFNEGTFYHCYLKFGAHRIQQDEMWGVHFALWAPNALSVSVVGNFNNWQGGVHRMKRLGESGIWVLFIPYLDEGEIYKYKINSPDGTSFLKADPWAFYTEVRPGTASIVYNLSGYAWEDDQWLKERRNNIKVEKPLNIYEVHFGSWKRKEGGEFYSYRELADELIPYVLEMGFTHIELLPIMEHPFDGSWGYQITGYYAATSRYGTPCDLKYFIDQCHQAGLGVILDWVPGHFCKDAHGLGNFDGTSLFEREEHEQWGTYKFNFSRREVWSFLIGNAVFWLAQFHIDGLRVDGVTSMLLLNYGKGDKPWKPNINGGREDLDAIIFLRTLNRVILSYYPDALMIAEEATDWPMVTKPGELGGLSFTHKWNMGWMNDILKYAQTDFPYRRERHNLFTFSLLYAFSEDFILPLSHDEVVHGKKSLVEKMPGDYWRKFAGLRLLLCAQICHPGKKLLFMGGELAQFIEWRYDQGLDWLLLKFDMHRKYKIFIKEINHFYLQEKSLWENDKNWSGFHWLEVDNNKQSVFIFLRRSVQAKEFVLVLLNFQPQVYEEYRIGVPIPGTYREILNTDDEKFGGSGKSNNKFIRSEEIPCHGLDYSIRIKVPPLAGVIFDRVIV
ncbi:MAG: 1,4-alpha-glucan branching protein GlgB [Dehalobacterium sp.]